MQPSSLIAEEKYKQSANILSLLLFGQIDTKQNKSTQNETEWNETKQLSSRARNSFGSQRDENDMFALSAGNVASSILCLNVVKLFETHRTSLKRFVYSLLCDHFALVLAVTHLPLIPLLAPSPPRLPLHFPRQ